MHDMSPYDARAWTEIEHWRERRLTAPRRSVIPAGVRDRAAQLGRSAHDRVAAVPGAPSVEDALRSAVGGLTELATRTAMASVRTGAVVAAFSKAGHAVTEIDDVRRLELREIDKVKPQLTIAYMASTAAEGAAAGFAVSGGELAALGGGIAGAGAGAAPGAAIVIGTMAVDAVAVLVAANRAVAHVAAYHGYDVREPGERLIALGVLGLGTSTGAGKVAAYAQLNKLVQELARQATWQQLRQSVITKVVERVFTQFGFDLTKRKLGQALPLVGVVVGAGMNAALLRAVVDDAEHVYRERFLRDQYGLDGVVTPGPTSVVGVDIAEIVEAEIVAEEHVPPDWPDAGR